MSLRAVRGFSLVELLAVVVLIAAVTAGLAVTLGGGLDGQRLRGAAREVAAQLAYTRGQAIVRGEPQFFELDVDAHSWRAPGSKSGTLPVDIELLVRSAAEERLEDRVARFRFFPDGSSSGGIVRLRMGEAQWRVDVVTLRRGEGER
jgi:general secretion pathway protein H